MIASAPISTALWTLLSSMSGSVQSREVPRLTLIFVLSMEPMPLGLMQVCFLLQGMIACPDATRGSSFSTSIPSFSATARSSSVTIPFLAASICVE